MKILKEIIKLPKEDKDERDERETLLDLYLRAMESEERAGLAAWHEQNASPPKGQIQ